ncbi:hypothetical protein C6499_05910 [Candidatus Poribacteria bacterium]|nr:MAG: hypothetical protein C6499_05910 [Candidatus Poribacteria bacterium]
MIIKSEMDQDQFDDFVSKIDTKHETIGIADKGLAQRLAKLYCDIYCDTNDGAYTFGMYKGLVNCNRTSTDEAFEYFSGTQISFNRRVIHSVFVNTLCCLRRITDKNNKTQSITGLKTKVEREIRDQIPNNCKVSGWFTCLEKQHTIIVNEMKPLLTYIDKRISHFERNWESKMKTSTIRDIGNIYHRIDRYTNTFRMFYEPIPSQSTTFISNGEADAARFIRTFHSSERLDNLRTEIFELLCTYESQPEQARQIDDLKTEILKLL